MAEVFHNPQFDKIIGAHSGIVERQKVFRDYEGNITKIGKKEGYTPHKRNYVAHPVVLGERDNQQAFGKVSHLAQEFIDAWKNNTPLPDSKQAFLDQVKSRFYKQLKGKPDPIAPKDKFGNYTIYARPDNFIRAVLHKEHPVFN